MPSSYIKKLSKEGKGSVKSLEKKWDEAKEAAEEQGQGDNYAYRTAIFKKMAHASNLGFDATELAIYARVFAMTDKPVS